MTTLDRREFIKRTVAAVGAAVGGQIVGCNDTAKTTAVPATRPAADASWRANEVVVLGNTGIKTSRLSIGTGTMGGREQREVGIDGMVKLFRHGLDEGVRWWDTAGMYRTHPHVAAALLRLQSGVNGFVISGMAQANGFR